MAVALCSPMPLILSIPSGPHGKQAGPLRHISPSNHRIIGLCQHSVDFHEHLSSSTTLITVLVTTTTSSYSSMQSHQKYQKYYYCWCSAKLADSVHSSDVEFCLPSFFLFSFFYNQSAASAKDGITILRVRPQICSRHLQKIFCTNL